MNLPFVGFLSRFSRENRADDLWMSTDFKAPIWIYRRQTDVQSGESRAWSAQPGEKPIKLDTETLALRHQKHSIIKGLIFKILITVTRIDTEKQNERGIWVVLWSDTWNSHTWGGVKSSDFPRTVSQNGNVLTPQQYATYQSGSGSPTLDSSFEISMVA